MPTVKAKVEIRPLKNVMNRRPYSAKPHPEEAILSHPKQFKSLQAVLNRRENRDKKKGTRLGHIYGEDHPAAVAYTKEENERQARDKKQSELVENFKNIVMNEKDL